MQTTLENGKKVAANFPISAFKKKNIIEEGGTLGLGVKREQESVDLKAHKMMRGRVEPSAVPTMVHVAKQITEIPLMRTPQ